MNQLVELHELRNDELFYLIRRGSYRLLVKIGNMTNGTVRCRQYYDTLRPDTYLDPSTKVVKIPKNVQKCLKSAIK